VNISISYVDGQMKAVV